MASQPGPGEAQLTSVVASAVSQAISQTREPAGGAVSINRSTISNHCPNGYVTNLLENQVCMFRTFLGQLKTGYHRFCEEMFLSIKKFSRYTLQP